MSVDDSTREATQVKGTDRTDGAIRDGFHWKSLGADSITTDRLEFIRQGLGNCVS